MIRTRLLIGSLLALAAAGVLFVDVYLAPWFPCLFFCLMVAGVLAGREMVGLFPAASRPSTSLVVAGILLSLAANWFPTLRAELGQSPTRPLYDAAYVAVLFVFLTTLIAAFLLEMNRYRGPGTAVPRLASAMLALAYLGLLPSCFVQIRFLPGPAVLLLGLTIGVPKCNDIAAFFTGTFVGRHRMTPLLSPKKTWEGFAGGMVGGVLFAIGLSSAAPGGLREVFPHGVGEAVGFGLAVGLAGVLGDLAESLLKREGQAKDASKSIPGFGGLLDVVDSVLFAAPVAYLWFVWNGR